MTDSANVPNSCANYGDVSGRIEIDPDVMLGKPVIRGTRIPVEIVLRKLSDGATTQALLSAYPRLTPDDIRAALVYAADTIAHETLVPWPEITVRFLADECCDYAAVDALRQAGHDVLAVAEFQQRSVDRELMALALETDRVLLTETKISARSSLPRVWIRPAWFFFGFRRRPGQAWRTPSRS